MQTLLESFGNLMINSDSDAISVLFKGLNLHTTFMESTEVILLFNSHLKHKKLLILNTK